MYEGATIGQYRVVGPLGRGGMGAVYVAEHVLVGRRAAVKVLLPELSARRDLVERFFNEARAMASIQDAGIVQMFDFGFHTDGSAYIVMELLEGETLDLRLARVGTLPAHDALRITRQAAGTLAAAHARGIVHRDLKPENVFIVADSEAAGGERAKLLDFGIAKLSSATPDRIRTQSGAFMGTPLYMSPEQCRGAGEIDHRADIYSLGCLLFHIATGHVPFEHEGLGEIIFAHIHDPPRAPSSIRPELTPAFDKLVLRCLAKKADDRFQTMLELRAACEDLITQLAPHYAGSRRASSPAVAVAATPVHGVASMATTLSDATGQPSLPEQPRPTARRRIVIAIASGLGVGAAVIAIALATGGGGSARSTGEPASATPAALPPPPPPPAPPPPASEPPPAAPVPPPPVAEVRPPIDAGSANSLKPSKPTVKKKPTVTKPPEDLYDDR